MQSIEEICKKYGIENYIINNDGSIDVDGNVVLINRGLKELPLNFNEVRGHFYCNDNDLTTLKGSPKYVSGGFECSNNLLTSLEFGPIEVGDDFYCKDNNLTSLKYSPKKVGNWYTCHNNNIIDLEGISDNIGVFLAIGESNPIGSIINQLVDIHFIIAFNSYRVIKDGKVQLKRLKYVMELFSMEYNIEEIEKYYTIV